MVVRGFDRAAFTECQECGLVMVWGLALPDGLGDGVFEAQSLIGASSFVCEHWSDHYEALSRVARNRSGRSVVGSVRAWSGVPGGR